MKRSRNKILISIGTLVLIALVIAGLEFSNTTHFFHKANTANQLRGDINYGAPTKADKQDSESRKSAPPSNGTSPNTPTSNTTKRSVDVEITTWNQDETALSVNGFVSGVVENNGTCTLTLKSENSSGSVAKQRIAEANATNTTCGEISIPNSSLPAGKWTAILSYSSPTAAGASTSLEIEVK